MSENEQCSQSEKARNQRCQTKIEVLKEKQSRNPDQVMDTGRAWTQNMENDAANVGRNWTRKHVSCALIVGRQRV